MARRSSNSNGESNGAGTAIEDEQLEFVAISEETRRRYLNYAMSVITSRALPDVRDGLKPVQRRILYVMFNDLRLMPEGGTRKCQKICGDTTGNYHPHGDQAVYDALVRLGQDFNLREPLITKQGNFGSVIGLDPAAPRYTEAKLAPIAVELMRELAARTVDTRANYDGTRQEPIVLPARYPNLLVNGTHGIAVGMATSIPPHNLPEVIKACVHLINNRDATVAQLMKHLKGPDFPLGGRIVSDRTTIRKAYEDGRGSIKVRGEWRNDKKKHRGKVVEIPDRLVITSIPYDVRSGNLVAEIGAIVESRKLPQLLDVNDETSEKNGLRITLDLKSGGDSEAVMAYLYKHTSLESNISLNLTALIPNEAGIAVPDRLSLKEILSHFVDFRFQVVTRRFQHELAQLEKRIHILEGFALVFDGLDKALKIIRRSSGKQDAAAKLMKAFPLDEMQTMALLELQLYRISNLEIARIVEELEEKQAEAERIRRTLKSDKRLWGVVKNELEEIATQFPDRRRTSIGSSEEITEFDPSTYIVRENTNVVVTRDGWIKRVGRMASVEGTRTREGDSVLEVAPASTLDQVIFFSSAGVAYTLPANSIPASTGYGEPLAKHVKMGDGDKMVAAVTTDERFTNPDKKKRGEPVPRPLLLIMTAQGMVARFSLSSLREASTKTGRKFCRLRAGDRVVQVELLDDEETVMLATANARVLHFEIEEVPILVNAGKGVKGIKLEKGDEVLGGRLMARPSDTLKAITTNGKEMSFGQTKYNVTSRAGKGHKTVQRSGFRTVIKPAIELVDWAEYE